MHMDQYWKQFVALATGSAHNGDDVFFVARLKLTAQYVLIIAVIVCGFSLFLFQSLERSLKDVNDDDFTGPESHQHFVDHTLGSLGNELLLADVIILLAAAGVSFALAGKTLKPIQRSLEAQTAFAANASHELRTPLAVIRNDIEVFLRHPAHTKEMAVVVMNSNLEEVKRMSGMVEDLLLLARSDNKVTPTYVDVHLNEVIQSVVDRLKPLALSKKVLLASENLDAVTIKGSASPLERAVLNILQNSLEHTPAGNSVHIDLKQGKTHVTLQISDSGAGIKLQDLPHVFTRFYKGESAAGTGLGLSIVKEIVDQHKGRITIASIEGKGSTVNIQFPLK